MEKEYSYLHQAIKNKDKPFIRTYLAKDNFKDIETLDPEQKIELLELLTLNDLQSLKLARLLIKSSSITSERHRSTVSKVCRNLERNTSDFKNLLILKGKIDFMKVRFHEEKQVECENVIES